MASTVELRGKIKVCMFDQYGTVVDMQIGLVEVATPFLKSKGWDGNPYKFEPVPEVEIADRGSR